ncbi:hypothetical protein K443DRAFT_90388 [Laccaria amethystina LaAM-08-1]|uniref:Uncharacterized protein n=1 Tax=Laccaria amethystina LaAM-08-1 TaxID=1095629 RepID=A0A0C9YCR0_9AGAR|nr:hypothetical protein K443DRAFT_90388 [Laccaria amethystina LaAM-08-1]
MRVCEAGDFVNKAECFLQVPVVPPQSSHSRLHRPIHQAPPGLHHLQRHLPRSQRPFPVPM